MAYGIAYGWLMAVWDGAGVGIRGGHWQAGHGLMGTWNVFCYPIQDSQSIPFQGYAVSSRQSIRKTNSCVVADCMLPHCSCVAECLVLCS